MLVSLVSFILAFVMPAALPIAPYPLPAPAPRSPRVASANAQTYGSGNVFEDLEMDEPEEMLAKAELARRIGNILKRRRPY